MADALTPGFQVELDPDEAERVGAFLEDVLTEQDAAESDDLAALASQGDDQAPARARLKPPRGWWMEKRYCPCLRPEKPITRWAWPRSHRKATGRICTPPGPWKRLQTPTARPNWKRPCSAKNSRPRWPALNDILTLMIWSRLGRAGVKRQIRATVNKAVAEVKQKQQQQQGPQQTQRQRRTRHAVNR